MASRRFIDGQQPDSTDHGRCRQTKQHRSFHRRPLLFLEPISAVFLRRNNRCQLQQKKTPRATRGRSGVFGESINEETPVVQALQGLP
jgi:hypothetical protein